MNIPQFAIPHGYEELFDEIAGILEFDAGQSRQNAETTTLRIIYAMHSDTQNISTIDESGTL